MLMGSQRMLVDLKPFDMGMQLYRTEDLVALKYANHMTNSILNTDVRVFSYTAYG